MSKIALYRKYRPSNFKEVNGQKHIIKTLEKAFINSQFSHAYIFAGPRGIGKTSVARIIAKGINCKNLKNGNPCNNCVHCKDIDEQRAVDVMEIDAASNRGIDEIRELREKVKFTPNELEYKVFIIDEAHMLTREAFNALLKTLEEPPEHVIFVLATTEIHKVPPTVISRCQRFDFKRISEEEISKILKKISDLEKIKIEKEAISVIARASEGGARDAISILDQISINASDKKIKKEDISELLGIVDIARLDEIMKAVEEGDKNNILNMIENMFEKGVDIGQLTKSLMDGYRKKIKESSNSVNIERYMKAVDILSECNRNFKYSLHPQLALEIALIKISRRGNSVANNDEEKGKKDKKAKEKEADKNNDSDDTPSNWSLVMSEIKSNSNSIYAVMKESTPSLIDNELHLDFPYKFHKERIENKKNKKIVEGAVNKVYGTYYMIICNLVERKDKKSKKIDEYLDILGGDVVG